jgi:uncharacterized coiled-coil DUF342 family protein
VETPKLPTPEWARAVLTRLDELPTVLQQQDTIGRLMTVVRGLQDERDALNKALADSRADVHKLRHENGELQQIIIKKLHG